jgi:hypothetical protein
MKRQFRLVLIVMFSLSLVAPEASALAQDEATPPVEVEAAAAPCADGKLRIGDLEGADATMQAGIEQAKQTALAWEEDSRLVAIQLRCPLLETGYFWEATFFSESAQAFWRSGTDEIQAADNDPSTVKTLITDNLSFEELGGRLQRAGYSSDLVINISTGVTVRYNTRDEPFGPPNAPVNVILYHVAIEERGQVNDVWVSVDDGTVYRYE